MAERMEHMSTLCYLKRDGQYLMLHRTVKKNDVNKDKWIGVGGHFELGESPEECICREVKEETGYTLTSFRYRGLLTFLSGNGVTEYMSLFTAEEFEGVPIDCDEGQLEWIPAERLWSLNLWEGDKIFFGVLDEETAFFSLKLVYDGKSRLTEAALDGRPLELFDVLDENGKPTGIVRERGVAHLDGSLHMTAHVWVVRESKEGGYDVLLQKRSRDKDSYPGCYDVSAAGHVRAPEGCLETAVRELSEELGISAAPAELQYVGERRCKISETFHGRPFLDYELSRVYVYAGQADISTLKLQDEEVEAVCWMALAQCERLVRENTKPHCIWPEELAMLRSFLGI